jgi:Resolvase, N terminal domain
VLPCYVRTSRGRAVFRNPGEIHSRGRFAASLNRSTAPDTHSWRTVNSQPSNGTRGPAVCPCLVLIGNRARAGAAEDDHIRDAEDDHIRDSDVVVVQKLDMLSRSLMDLLRSIERIQRKGVGFQSLSESTTPQLPPPNNVADGWMLLQNPSVR